MRASTTGVAPAATLRGATPSPRNGFRPYRCEGLGPRNLAASGPAGFGPAFRGHRHRVRDEHTGAESDPAAGTAAGSDDVPPDLLQQLTDAITAIRSHGALLSGLEPGEAGQASDGDAPQPGPS